MRRSENDDKRRRKDKRDLFDCGHFSQIVVS